MDERAIIKAILEEIAQRVDAGLRKMAPAIKGRIGRIFEDAMVASPEYASLLGGRLRGELGVVNPRVALEEIVGLVRQSISVVHDRVRVQGDRLAGGMRIELLRGMASVLSLPSAKFISENGHTVPWLSWLLTAGDAIVLADYAYYPGHWDFSRTNQGFMRVPGPTAVRRAGWGVPSEFAGTDGDNWIFRALASAMPEVTKAIAQELEAVL
jgi:hypothetical protein